MPITAYKLKNTQSIYVCEKWLCERMQLNHLRMLQLGLWVGKISGNSTGKFPEIHSNLSGNIKKFPISTLHTPKYYSLFDISSVLDVTKLVKMTAIILTANVIASRLLALHTIYLYVPIDSKAVTNLSENFQNFLEISS